MLMGMREHLLPQFRIAALTKFSKGGEKDVFLSGSCPKGEGAKPARNGVVLYRRARARLSRATRVRLTPHCL